MAFTQANLDALKQAYAAGALQVRIDGKMVTYGSAADLLSRIRVIEADLTAQSGATRPVAGFAGFSRGNP